MGNEDLPESYTDLQRSAIGQDICLMDTVLAPTVLVDRSENGEVIIQLGAIRYVRGVEKYLYAPTITHNYVLDGRKAFPLPSDIKCVLMSFFSGKALSNLTITDILNGSIRPTPSFSIKVSQKVFCSGRELSERIGKDLDVPNLLRAELYEYQKNGVAWLIHSLKECGGVILADEMGLGKTVQVIATLLQLGPTRDMPSLIICPTSLIANWSNEIKKFAPSLDINVHRGEGRAGVSSTLKTAKIVLSTYETVVSDETLFRSIRWSSIICDEAQAIKNPQSNRRAIVASLISKYRLLMTGTPVETSLQDIWSLMDICVPGILGDLAAFENDFPNTQDSASRLNKLVSPLILRRTVADVAKDLPDRIDIELPLELDRSQALKYEEIRKQAQEEYRKAGGLVATARLSVFCAFPRVDFDKFNIDSFEDTVFDMADLRTRTTPKLEITRALIEEAIATSKKVIIFSNYNHISLVLKSLCRDCEIDYWNAINGSTPQELRQKIIDDFSASRGSAVLILNPKAAGAGLNITAATMVIHYTPVWNPALEMQASARAHRRGQTQPVTIYQLYYKDTVEQVMVERARFRRELGDRVIPDLSKEKDDLNKAVSISPTS